MLRRGLVIPSHADAERFLGHISFHRLQGYWKPLEAGAGDSVARRFRSGVSFADIIERYDFDQQLRNLLMDAFNHIEVSVRTQWTYNLAHISGGERFAHHDAKLFRRYHAKNLNRLEEDYKRKVVNRQRYSFADCPVWAVVEIMSFGQLSRWYDDTLRPLRQAVARHYGIDEKIFRSLLHHLAIVRNICAHHERLWDIEFVSPFIIPRWLGNFENTRQLFNRDAKGKIYNTLRMIAYLMARISPAAGWPERLTALLAKHGRIPQSSMGFPPNWQSQGGSFVEDTPN